MFTWKIINEKYIDFLRNNYESRIPHTNYGADKLKPFFGALFETDDFIYVTQVSSPKTRHYQMKNSIDFIKILLPNGRLISVVNLNYMFPVPKKELHDLSYKDIDKYVTFSDSTKRTKYIYLLQTELKIINTLPLEQMALNLYFRKIQNPEDVVSMRCFDFVALQNAAYDWLGIEPKEVNIINKSNKT